MPAMARTMRNCFAVVAAVAGIAREKSSEAKVRVVGVCGGCVLFRLRML